MDLGAGLTYGHYYSPEMHIRQDPPTLIHLTRACDIVLHSLTSDSICLDMRKWRTPNILPYVNPIYSIHDAGS
jgi:hypothetical protein